MFSKVIIPVSTAIRSVYYQKNTKELMINFHNDRCYIYEEVEPETVGRFESSESAGKFLNKYIIGKYDYYEFSHNVENDNQELNNATKGLG